MAGYAITSLDHPLPYVKFLWGTCPKYERPKKLILGGSNLWSYFSICRLKYTKLGTLVRE